MEFGILGPLEVRDSGAPLPLGGAKQRALLAILLLHSNEVVSTDRLVDELWGDGPPENAVKTLQVHVSQLRKSLRGNNAVLTRAPGYLLHVEEGDVDAQRFERLVSEARSQPAAKASAMLREALTLWRGPALADFAYESFAQTETARLEALRMTAVEERLAADLELGHHAELVGELEALMARHPLRERLRGLLILALYRSGRQAEALDAYADARRALVEELGIEPSRELVELQRAVLAQDASLHLQPPSRPHPRARRHVTPFVGREKELAELGEALKDALAGSGGVVLLAGEPGIGKSRLADELADVAEARGARVLFGRCWEAGGAPAYWPWVQALRAYVRNCDRDTLRAQIGAGGAELAHLLPELGELFPGLPPLQSPESEGARFRLFDSVTGFVRNAAGAEPLLMVLDDLHAADLPSLLLLQFLAGAVSGSALLVLGTYRDVEVGPGHPLASSLSELAREPATRMMALTGLARDEVGVLIEATAGMSASEALAAAIHDRTEGNPLFAGELVRLLAAEGRLEEASATGPSRLALPREVSQVILRRLQGLSDDCRRLLLTAAVLGRDFGLDALERATGASRAECLDVLDEAMSARVIGDVPGARGRLRFSHALVRDALYDELTAARRMSMHANVGQALEELYAEDPEPHLAELAHHFFAAGGDELGKALDYSRRAGDRAAELLAYEEAVRLYRMAIEVLDLTASGDESTRSELLLALGDVQARAGDGSGAKETFLEAIEIARKSRMGNELSTAALGYGGRFVWPRAGADGQLVPLIREALDGLGEEDSVLRARLLARLAGALRGQSSHAARASISQQAVEITRRLGDPATLAYALDGSCAVLLGADNPEERLALGAELIDAGEQAGELERALSGHQHRLMASLELGDMETVGAEKEIVTAMAEELRQPVHLWHARAGETFDATFRGGWELAERLNQEALELGRGAQGSDAVISFCVQLFLIRRAQGREAEAKSVLERFSAEYRDRPLFLCALANVNAALGHETEARELLERVAGPDFGGLPRDGELLLELCLLPEVCAAVGDVECATLLYDLLLPYAGRIVKSYTEGCIGSASRYLGILAATLERWDAAADHFNQAYETNLRTGGRPWAAYACHDHARMILRRGRPEDLPRARELLARAMTIYEELGMDAWVSRASALMAGDAASLPREPAPPRLTADRPVAAEQVARAALGYGGRLLSERAGSDERLVPLLEDALSSLGEEDSLLRVQLLSRMASALRGEPSRERRVRLGEEAVAIARRLGDPATLAYALHASFVAGEGPDGVRERMAVADEIISLAQRTGDAERELEARELLFETAWTLGDLDVRAAQLEPMSRLAEQLKQPTQRWLVLTCRTMLALSAGHFEAGEELMDEALSAGQQAQTWGAVAAHTLQSFVLLREKGRLEELRGVVTAEPERFPSKLVQRAVSAHLDGQLGRRDEARRALQEVLAEDLSQLYVDEEWLFSMSLLADPCALAGDDRLASRLYELLRPYAGLNAVAPPEVTFGAVDRGLGVLATVLGYWEDAFRHFEDALATNERMGARPWCAHTLHDHARMLLARRQGGDGERAGALLDDACALYGELGMASWVDRAEGLAQQLAGRLRPAI